MWKELLEVFRGVEPLKDVADRFMEMLAICLRMAEKVRPHVHDHSLDAAKWKELLELDGQVNDGEWAIRRALVSHLAIQKSELPFCLKLMSLVKDTERLGEYVKNVAEVSRSAEGAVTDGPIHAATEELVAAAMRLFSEAGEIIAQGDTERAHASIAAGKAALQCSDDLTKAVAGSNLTAAQASSTALVAFFYRRVVSHLINLVSSVVLPVHELDRYDERFESA